MTSKLIRDNGEVIILSEKELKFVYEDARIAWTKDYVCELLKDRRIDLDKIEDAKIEEITASFIHNLDGCFGDDLFDLEDTAFTYTINEDFPEYGAK